MTMNALTKVKNLFQDVIRVDFDQRTNQHVATSSNRIMGIGKITVVAEEEVTEIFVKGRYLSAQDMEVNKAIEEDLEANGVPPQEYQLLFNMLNQQYMKTMTRIMQDGAEAVVKEAANSHR